MGASIALLARREERLVEIAERLKEYGGDFSSYKV